MSSFGTAIKGASSSGGGFDYLGLVMNALPLLGGGNQQQIQAPPPPGLLGPAPKLGQEDVQPLIRSNPDAGTLNEAITPPASEQLPEPKPTLGERASGFLGNIDNTLQSPSRMIGLGLLNNQDPRLAIGALIASGLLGNQDG